jgi:acyl carrier protein
MTRTRDQILTEVLALLNSVAQDWEFEGTVGESTRLFADLAFESLDLVILGAKVQEQFGQTFPFPSCSPSWGGGTRAISAWVSGWTSSRSTRSRRRPRRPARPRHRSTYES